MLTLTLRRQISKKCIAVTPKEVAHLKIQLFTSGLASLLHYCTERMYLLIRKGQSAQKDHIGVKIE